MKKPITARYRWIRRTAPEDRKFPLPERWAPLGDVARQVLLTRLPADVEDVSRFLSPALQDLHDPFLLEDMEPAVECILQAFDSGQKVLVHGDYDVDGITSTALLVRVLAMWGLDVGFYVPDRRSEGYGLSRKSVERAHEDGCKLIITVDCGVTCFDEIDLARDLGIDVVVTDHHEPLDRLPKAVAVIDPKREGSSYPFRDLAGVGVALKLLQGLAARRSSLAHRLHVEALLRVAAIGTIADVVPLVGENRVIVALGLSSLPKARAPGLRALMRIAGLEGRAVSARDIGFRMGPRINAIGRLHDANHAVELLLSQDQAEADRLAEMLESANRERQVTQGKVFDDAIVQAREQARDESRRVLFLTGENWNSGVIGIVASKIKDQFHLPTFIVSVEDGLGRGSARSIPEFHVQRALTECAECFVQYGGHAAAGGFKADPQHLPQIQASIEETGRRELPDHALVQQLDYDSEVALEEVTEDLLHYFKSLGPFGQGNPPPLLVTRAAVVAAPPRVFRGRLGLKLGSSPNSTGPIFDAVMWGEGGRELAEQIDVRDRLDLAFAPQFDDFGNRRRIRLVVQDLATYG